LGFRVTDKSLVQQMINNDASPAEETMKLSSEEYNLLRKKVLDQDAWRCQTCGSLNDLHVHHLVQRSKLGDDVMDNLIALCASCHKMQHRFHSTVSRRLLSEPGYRPAGAGRSAGSSSCRRWLYRAQVEIGLGFTD
jgi:HNH endonuclease